jgi:hypothetical protein
MKIAVLILHVDGEGLRGEQAAHQHVTRGVSGAGRNKAAGGAARDRMELRRRFEPNQLSQESTHNLVRYDVSMF